MFFAFSFKYMLELKIYILAIVEIIGKLEIHPFLARDVPVLQHKPKLRHTRCIILNVLDEQENESNTVWSLCDVVVTSYG